MTCDKVNAKVEVQIRCSGKILEIKDTNSIREKKVYE